MTAGEKDDDSASTAEEGAETPESERPKAGEASTGTTGAMPSVTPEFEEEFPSVATDPGADDSQSARVDETGAGPPGDESPPGAPDETSGDGLGWQGWVLVGGLVVAMVLVPWAIVFLPTIQGALGSLGLGLRDAYLVLPMIPALGLGVLAVWAAVAYRRRED
jgi:hypothetical protein